MSKKRTGRLVPVPSICSPLADIDNADNSVRLLFDAIISQNLSLNSYTGEDVHVKYERV